MITPEEIKNQCTRCWQDVLRATVNNTDFFPKEIQRIGKVKTKGIVSNVVKYSQSIDELRKQSKEFKTFGYTITWEERNFDRIGKNSIPGKIEIENLEDYLRFLSKEKEYDYFKKQSELILISIPKLKDWIITNPLKVIEHKHWSDTLKVCHYFLQNPKPDLYIRQLPVEVHTKFIKEENETLFRSLFDFLIPEHINLSETKFEKRYNLRYSEPLIRIRFLDRSLSCNDSISDLAITISEFQTYQCDCTKILVTENIMNFLTLPYLKGTIALWSGGGFNVSYLKDIKWLKNKLFFYWGDIDTHGFQILNQFRSYFPNTISLMMDKETLENFKPYIKKGEPTNSHTLSNLFQDEIDLFNYLKIENIRLEQEKITQLYSESKIVKIMMTSI